MSETFVEAFTHLKNRPKSDQALPLLQRIASLVKPIMRKHKWKLPMLSEFFPDNPSLLVDEGMNVGGGLKILIRLRPAHSPDTFYDDEDLVGTMLHELTHNVHGPHDAKFYKLLGELEEEYDRLKDSGYSGEGFHSAGRKVGVGVSHNLPPHLARLKAVEAAERRQKVQAVMGGSGRRLGGRPRGTLKELSPRELAAQAAERRARDDKACGFSHDEEVMREADKAAKDSLEDKSVDIIDLTGDAPEAMETGEIASRIHTTSGRSTDTEAVVDGPSSEEGRNRVQPLLISPAPINHATGTSKRQLESPSSITPTKRSRQASFWTCATCTLHNEMNAESCAVCCTTRPGNVWSCPVCVEKDIPSSFWSCPFCGTVKSIS